MLVGQLRFLSSNMSEDVFEIFWGGSEDEGKSPAAWCCGETKSALL